MIELDTTYQPVRLTMKEYEDLEDLHHAIALYLEEENKQLPSPTERYYRLCGTLKELEKYL